MLYLKGLEKGTLFEPLYLVGPGKRVLNQWSHKAKGLKVRIKIKHSCKKGTLGRLDKIDL